MSQSFREMANYLNGVTDYENMIDNMTVPSNRKKFNISNVEWFLKNGEPFNRSNPNFSKLKQACRDIIDNYHAIKSKKVS